MGHILRGGIVAHFQFILDFRVSLPWFFIAVNFFVLTIYMSFLNATLGGHYLKHAGHPWGTFLLSKRIPQISVLWGLAGAADVVFMGRNVGLF